MPLHGMRGSIKHSLRKARGWPCLSREVGPGDSRVSPSSLTHSVRTEEGRARKSKVQPLIHVQSKMWFAALPPSAVSPCALAPSSSAQQSSSSKDSSSYWITQNALNSLNYPGTAYRECSLLWEIRPVMQCSSFRSSFFTHTHTVKQSCVR